MLERRWISGLIAPMKTWWTDSEPPVIQLQGKITLHCIFSLPVGHRVNIFACLN